MVNDQTDTTPLGIRRLPRRTIVALAVPHFACSEQRQVRRWTRQAARHADPVRACKGHAGTSEQGASPLTSGESARFPLGPRAERQASPASFCTLYKRSTQCSMKRGARREDSGRHKNRVEFVPVLLPPIVSNA